MTESQKQFEEWFFSEIDGGTGTEELCWQAWQASRAAIVVKLSDWDCYDTPRQALEACEDRLSDAGVRYE